MLSKGAKCSLEDPKANKAVNLAVEKVKEVLANTDFTPPDPKIVLTEDSKYDLDRNAIKKKHSKQKLLNLIEIIKQLDSHEEKGPKFDVGQIDKVSEAINQWDCDKPNAIEGHTILGLWNNLIEKGAQGEDSKNLETLLTQLLGEPTQVEEI